MLPAASRLRRRPDFAATVRGGRRAGRSRLVVHLDASRADFTRLDGEPSDSAPSADHAAQHSSCAPARAGFVVGRAVGPAVVRNRVRRQLRHLVADRLTTLPAGSTLVVRALPAAAGASSAELARDLDSALARAASGPSPAPRRRSQLLGARDE